MYKAEVITDYSKLPDHDLDNFAQKIYNSLNPNTNFTWAATVMPGLATDITSYKSKLEAPTVNTTAKNAAKQKLAKTLHTIAVSVNTQADGDINKLKSTAFTLAKEPTKIGILPKPEGFKVEAGENAGQIKFSVNAHSNATMYLFYCSPEPAPADITKWQAIISSTRTKTVSKFASGVRHKCVCAYKGAADEVIYSDALYIYVQ